MYRVVDLRVCEQNGPVGGKLCVGCGSELKVVAVESSGQNRRGASLPVYDGFDIDDLVVCTLVRVVEIRDPFVDISLPIKVGGYGPDADRKRVYLSLQSIQIGAICLRSRRHGTLRGIVGRPAAEIAEPPQMDMSFVVRWCSFMVSIRKKKLGS